MFRIIYAALIPIVLTSCLNPPSFFKSGQAGQASSSSVNQVDMTYSAETGESVARLGGNSGETQTMSAPEGSPVAGTSISFPPGSLSISTDIILSAGADIAASENVVEKLGLGASSSISGVGTPVSITAGDSIEAAAPFTITLSISESALKLLQDTKHYAVLYKANIVSENKVSLGVIPTLEVQITDGKLSFQTKYFGTFQVISSPEPIVKKADVVVASIDVTEPAELHQVIPYVIDAGKTVEIHGKSFSGKMTLALGNIPVRNLNVMSDVKATFVVPEGVDFGPKKILLAQAGTTVSSPVITRSAGKTGLPLITIDASGVCAGTKYYDINGNEQVGTRTCSAGGDMAKSTYDANGNGIVDAADSADMLKSTFDTNNDGIVDQAASAATAQSANTALSATTAVTATTALNATTAQTASTALNATNASAAEYAEYALGTRGSSLPSGATVSIPDTASAYDITGTTYISSFGLGSAGREVTLRFTAETMVSPSSTLYLKFKRPFIASNNSTLKLVGTGSGWAEVSRSENGNKDYVFLGYIGPSGITRATTDAEENTWTSLVFDWADFDSTKFTFSSGVLSPTVNQMYNIEFKQYWKTTVQAATGWSSECKLGMVEGTSLTYSIGTYFDQGSTVCSHKSNVNWWMYTWQNYSFSKKWFWSTDSSEGNINLKSGADGDTFILIK